MLFIWLAEGSLEGFLKLVTVLKDFKSLGPLRDFVVFEVVLEGWFELCECISCEVLGCGGNFIGLSMELVIVVV